MHELRFFSVAQGRLWLVSMIVPPPQWKQSSR